MALIFINTGINKLESRPIETKKKTAMFLIWAGNVSVRVVAKKLEDRLEKKRNPKNKMLIITPEVPSIQLWQVYGERMAIEIPKIKIPVKMIICPLGLDRVMTMQPRMGMVVSCDTPLRIPLTYMLILSWPKRRAGAYNWNMMQKNRQLTLMMSGLTEAYLNRSINQKVYFSFF